MVSTHADVVQKWSFQWKLRGALAIALAALLIAALAPVYPATATSDASSVGVPLTTNAPAEGATSDRVWAWGANRSGQLGDGTTTRRLAPVRTGVLTGIVDISSGFTHSLALESAGRVWSWGSAEGASLGIGGHSCENLSTKVPLQVNELTGVVNVSAGGRFSVALKSDGTVWAWGLNQSHRVGSDDVDSCGGVFIPYLGPVQVEGLSEVVEVDAGGGHSLALKSDGTVWAWGANGDGQLGDGTATSRAAPAQVTGLPEIVDVSAGTHSLALSSDGRVWAWGRNFDGQLGDGTTTNRSTPVGVSGPSGVVSVEAGAGHSLAIMGDGTVLAWGQNDNGQLGDGTRITRATPVQVSGLKGVVQVAAGTYHSLALRSDGTTWAWGGGWEGQLGDDSRATRRTPVQARGLSGTIAISAGSEYSLALAADASRSESKTMLSLSKTPRTGSSRVKVRGAVSPNHSGLRVKVILYKEMSPGRFRSKDTKRPRLDAKGAYATSFPRQRRGTCKVVTTFLGDAGHLPSKAAKRFNC